MLRKYFSAGWMLMVSFLPAGKTLAQTPTIGLISHSSGSEDDGYVLFAPVTGCDTTYLIDKCGRWVHKWGSAYTPGLDVYLLPDGTLLRSGNYPDSVFDPAGGSAGGIIERFDWDGHLIWQYRLADSLETQNHDICYLPNGHILAAVWEVISDSEAIANGRNPAYLGLNLFVAKIMEIQPVGADSGDIVWQWRVWDHLIQDYDSTKLNYGVVADHPELLNLNYYNADANPAIAQDWLHLNAVTYNSGLDQVMLSLHNMNEIYIIDHGTSTANAATHSGGVHNKGGDFLYRWGNPVVYDRGTVADDKLFQQHDPVWITTGRYKNDIMIFNNGLDRPGGNASSVDIISPPVDSAGNYFLQSDSAFGPDTLTWTYQDPIPGNFFSEYMGGAQMLSNGNILICNAIPGVFFEIDSTKNIVWEYINPVNNGAYSLQGTPTGDITFNSVYRCTFYQSSYSGFSGDIIPAGIAPLESNPLPYTCVFNPDAATEVQAKGNTIEVFPNPANSTLNIQCPSLQSVVLTDVTGRSVIGQTFKNEASAVLETATVPGGLYIVCINGWQYRQVVIAH